MLDEAHMNKRMLKIRKNDYTWNGALSKKIEGTGLLEDWSNPRTKTFWSLSKTKNKEGRRWLHILIFYLFSLFSSTTNKLLTFLPMPWFKYCWGLELDFACRITKYPLRHWVVSSFSSRPAPLSRGSEANITSILKTLENRSLPSFPSYLCHSALQAWEGLAHVLWASLPWQTCVAVGACLGSYRPGSLRFHPFGPVYLLNRFP